jgi:hypothetical protein
MGRTIKIPQSPAPKYCPPCASDRATQPREPLAIRQHGSEICGPCNPLKYATRALLRAAGIRKAKPSWDYFATPEGRRGLAAAIRASRAKCGARASNRQHVDAMRFYMQNF